MLFHHGLKNLVVVPSSDSATTHYKGGGFGNAGVGLFKGPGQQNWDLSIMKRFSVRWPRESAQLEFRSEFFNAFNHPQFGDPDLEFTSPSFGQISTTVVNPRVVQFALKYTF